MVPPIPTGRKSLLVTVAMVLIVANATFGVAGNAAVQADSTAEIDSEFANAYENVAEEDREPPQIAQTLDQYTPDPTGGAIDQEIRKWTTGMVKTALTAAEAQAKFFFTTGLSDSPLFVPVSQLLSAFWLGFSVTLVGFAFKEELRIFDGVLST